MNASRKKDRETIASWFIDAATRHGASIERTEEPANPGYSGASIKLCFTLNGVGVRVSIDNLHGPSAGIALWYKDWRREKSGKFTPEFNVAVGDLSQYQPHHKATSFGDWATLALYVDRGLRLASLNQAFLEESEA